MNKIYLIMTGGTIGKIYNEFKGHMENQPNGNHFLKQLRLPYLDIEIVEIMCKDSLDITEGDRNDLLNTILNLQKHNQPIIILHGTDRMVTSAKFCKENLSKINIPIIFTGSMKPMDCINSDAIQNITESIMACQIVCPDIYISFHSTLFDVNNVRKNKKMLRFEKLNDNFITTDTID